MIGGKLQIIRLCVMLLPLISLLIPSASAVMSLPFRSDSIAVSAPGIYQLFAGGGFSLISSYDASQTVGEVFRALSACVYAQAVAAVFAVLAFLLSLLSFISIKNMQKIICTVCAPGIVGSAAVGALCCRFIKVISSSDISLVSGSVGYGCIITIICFAIVFTVNLLLQKRGIKVEYEEGDLERLAIAKKVKRGEISIDDLPQPVVETAATRKIEEEIEKERIQIQQRKQAEQKKAAAAAGADGRKELKG